MKYFKRRRAEFEETIKDLESRLKSRGISIDEEYLRPDLIKSLAYFLGSGDDREEVVKWFREKRKLSGFDIEIVTEKELRDRFGHNTEPFGSRLYVSQFTNSGRARAIKVGLKHNVNYKEQLAAYLHWRDHEGKIYYKVLEFRAEQFECVFCRGLGGGFENIPVSIPGGNAIISESGQYQTCNNCCGKGKVNTPNFSDEEFRIYDKIIKEKGLRGYPSQYWGAFLIIQK